MLTDIARALGLAPPAPAPAAPRLDFRPRLRVLGPRPIGRVGWDWQVYAGAGGWELDSGKARTWDEAMAVGCAALAGHTLRHHMEQA